MKTKNELIQELLDFIKELPVEKMDYSINMDDEFVDGYNDAVNDAKHYTQRHLEEFEKDFNQLQLKD